MTFRDAGTIGGVPAAEAVRSKSYRLREYWQHPARASGIDVLPEPGTM
jgi:hypothetical protein